MAETPQFHDPDADQPVPDPAAETNQPVQQEADATQIAPEAVVEPVPEPTTEPVLEAEPLHPPLVETLAEPVVEPVAEPIADPVVDPMQQPEPVAPSESGPGVTVPEPAVELIEPASLPEGVASTITVPPRPGPDDGEGGEWDLLLGKVRAWIDGARFQERWDALGGPLRAVGLLLAALLVLRLYGALLDTLGDLPLLPRLLQLVGLISLSRFALTRLVRSSERERILTSWRQRWDDFRGRA